MIVASATTLLVAITTTMNPALRPPGDHPIRSYPTTKNNPALLGPALGCPAVHTH